MHIQLINVRCVQQKEWQSSTMFSQFQKPAVYSPIFVMEQVMSLPKAPQGVLRAFTKVFKLSKCPGSFLSILKYSSNPHAHAFLKQSLAIDQVFPTLPRPQTASKKLERTKEVSPYLPDSREAMKSKDVYFFVMRSPLALWSLTLSKCYEVVFLTICRTSNFL